MIAIISSPCSLNLICGRKNHQLLHQRISQNAVFTMLNLPCSGINTTIKHIITRRKKASLFAKSSESEESVPSWAKPGSDDPPPWARDEGKQNDLKADFDVPFYVYLLASAITAIAAIGSIFEYANKNPVFGVLNPDSIFYAPLLGFFAFTGIPTSAFLWFKSVQAANKEAEEQDRRDGFR